MEENKGYYFRVREYTRPFKQGQPYQDGMNPYWVYCSGSFDDYYEAIKYALEYEGRTKISCWVECLMDCEYDF